MRRTPATHLPFLSWRPPTPPSFRLPALAQSQFGGAAQFDGGAGGGFMQNMAVDNSTPDGKAKGEKNRQSLVPVTIKQLKNAPANTNGEQGFVLDGHELQQVTIVGLIIAADEQSTNLMYTIDDGTDNIMVRMWVDSDSDEALAERRAQWKEGVVVRVIGQLRVFNSSKSVVAYSINPVTDFNEYTFHFLEVVHTHLRHTKGAPPAPAGAVGAAGGAYAAPAAPAAGGAAYAAPQQSGSLEDLVFSFFRTKGESSEQGCTVTEASDALAANGASIEQVRQYVDNLVSEGHLYSTIDDDHFKATA
jgi:replication factor A2